MVERCLYDIDFQSFVLMYCGRIWNVRKGEKIDWWFKIYNLILIEQWFII